MTYTELATPDSGSVLCVWSRTIPEAAELRIVPDACADLIFDGERLWVAGLDTSANVAGYGRGLMVGARLAPGTIPRGLGIAADELRDRRVDLLDLWPAARVRRLADDLAGAKGITAQQAVLVRALRQADTVADTVADPVVPAVLGGGPVSAIAARLGLSERQVNRRCGIAFGYGPKTVHKVLRFQRALRLARKGNRLSDVAATAGYSDQAHLARDVRALAGVPMGQLLMRPTGTDSG